VRNDHTVGSSRE